MTPEEERAVAVALFNHAWTLMGRERTRDEDDELLHCAHRA